MRALPPLPEICGSGVPPIVPRTETNVNACGQKVPAPVYKAGTHFRRFCPPLRRERPRRETGRPVPKNRAIPANLYRLHKDEALALEEMTRKRQKSADSGIEIPACCIQERTSPARSGRCLRRYARRGAAFFPNRTKNCLKNWMQILKCFLHSGTKL